MLDFSRILSYNMYVLNTYQNILENERKLKMARYSIHEHQINSLEKKLATIKNKCVQYGCEFNYERIGEEFKKVKTREGREIIQRYIIVEASGTAIINDWRFIAVIDHTNNGNIIRQYDNTIEVPSKFRTCEPVCEHCNTVRNRRDTFVIYNDKTDEWKQVGRSCLQDFTNGRNAEWVAMFASYFDELAKEDKSEAIYDKSSYKYYPAADILMYGYECVKHFGWSSASNSDSTAYRADLFHSYIELKLRVDEYAQQFIEDTISKYGFKAITDDNAKAVDEMIKWVIEQDSTDSTYMHNLQVICKSRYCKCKDFPILISLIATYNRHKAEEAASRKRAEAHNIAVKRSKHIGKVKEWLEFKVSQAYLVTTWDTMYGTSAMYKFIDTDGNELIWITSNYLELDNIESIKCKVKEHSEYNGVKQTVINYCKATYKEDK